jgi:hypothetical protein
MLDEVVGLRELLQTRIAAVEEAPGVAHQAVASEFKQTLSGFCVAR